METALTGNTNAPDGQTFRPLIVGDLHISDKHSGRHVDYFRDCVEFLQQITDSIRDNKITHLFLTGDLIGRKREKNLTSRDSLSYFMQVLVQWNKLTNNNVYSVRGNHDYGEKLTDFEMFTSLGFIKNVEEVDVGDVRFHLVGYNEHTRPLAIDGDKFNVVIGHSEFHVEGATNWFFRSPEGVNLSSLENFYGVEWVIGGHIHTPSQRVVQTSIRDKTVSLFYPGNGTRPVYDKNVWEKCYGVIFETDNDHTAIKQIEYKLRPSHEVFQQTFDDVETTDELTDVRESESFNIEHLTEILSDLNKYNLVGDSDYKNQIKKFGGLDEEAVELAVQYIEQVEREFN